MKNLFATAMVCLIAGGAAAQPIAGPMTTPAARADRARLCPAGAGYPAAWDWPANLTQGGMRPATGGRPRIEQYRGGKLIAVYSRLVNGPGCTMKQDGTDWRNPRGPAASGCGPFTRSHSWRLFAPGDDFRIYPAVYAGPENMPWIGPIFTGDRPWPEGMVAPDHVTIEGVPQGNVYPVILSATGGASDNTLGMAPVYLDRSTGLTLKNLVIASTGPQVQALKAALYNVAASNLTMDHVRITGFEAPSATTNGANGIFGADDYTGWWRMTDVETDHNGGSTGAQQHAIYIGASRTDPAYTVTIDHLYSHDTVQGHLLKCRCQRLVLTGSYLDGGVPQPGETQADDYDVDMPNGGELVARGNILVKNASGPDTNGIGLAWMMEGNPDGRPLSLDIENNIFVTFAKSYDGSHPNVPMSFLYPPMAPSNLAFPKLALPAVIRDNAFVGYCPASLPALDYRGTFPVAAGFSEVNPDYSLTRKFSPADGATGAVGGSTYGHIAHGGAPRTHPTIGAFD